MGHLNGILARVGGNLNNNFQKSQMPGGGILKLRFDRYITVMNSKRQDSQWPFDVNVVLNLSIVVPLWLLMRRFSQSFCLFSPCSVSLYKRHFEITCYHNNLIMALSSVIYSPIALFFALNHICSKSHLLALNRNISVSYEITCFKKRFRFHFSTNRFF